MIAGAFPRAVSLLLAATIAACAQRLPCDSGEARFSAQLLFGRAIGTQGEVSETEWQDFLATTVAPAFPDGLTVFDTEGRWRDATTGVLVRERGKAVTILIDDPVTARAKLDAVADTYKRRFSQDAIGIVIAPACVAFR